MPYGGTVPVDSEALWDAFTVNVWKDFHYNNSLYVREETKLNDEANKIIVPLTCKRQNPHC